VGLSFDRYDSVASNYRRRSVLLGRLGINTEGSSMSALRLRHDSAKSNEDMLDRFNDHIEEYFT